MADILRLRKRIPEPLLSSMFQKLLHVSRQFISGSAKFNQILGQFVVILSLSLLSLWKGLSYLHGVRYLVHRDIKPANLLINLKGEPKITDFGISAGLENSMAMVGEVDASL